MSDLTISAQKYPKIVSQEEEKFQEIHNTVFQNYVFFLWHFDVVFHMLMVIKKRPPTDKKKCSLDKTGEGIVVSDFSISPQKYPKIGTQEKEKYQGICDTVFQNYVFFYGVLPSFLTCLGA